nr:reverse transcriptase domain-containing protein [Tanacetum cinerariifolium]
MMVRLDDFVRSEEALANTELPKGEVSETSKKLAGSLSPKKENHDRYCDYHEEKGHFTNDCFQRGQMKSSLEFGKLNHVIKDVRQSGRRNSKGRDEGKDKVINMIQSWSNERKKNSVEKEESLMKAPIVFSAVSAEDVSDEPLIVDVVMDGYLVRIIHVDQGASVEVMLEHCFENMSPEIKPRLKSTQTDLVGFARDVVKTMGKIELEVVFGDGGLFRRKTREEVTEKEAHQDTPLVKAESGEVGLTKKSQIRRNLEAYVDGMVIKRNDEKILLADIAETFDNLWRINMKLNLKKCSSRVEEGKFLGYMSFTLLRYPKEHNERKQGTVHVDGRGVKSLPRNKEGHSRALIVNHPKERGNGVCIPGDSSEGQALVGTKPDLFFHVPTRMQEKDDIEKWTLFTDGASNSKVSEARLVLINPSSMEFTYALRGSA